MPSPRSKKTTPRSSKSSAGSQQTDAIRQAYVAHTLASMLYQQIVTRHPWVCATAVQLPQIQAPWAWPGVTPSAFGNPSASETIPR